MSSFLIGFLEEVTPADVATINHLLRLLHSQVREHNVLSITNILQRSRIITAREKGRIVGIMVMAAHTCLTHTGAMCNNIVTSHENADLAIIQMMEFALSARMMEHAQFVEFIFGANNPPSFAVADWLEQQKATEDARRHFRLKSRA